MSEIPETVKRWTARRRVALVLELLRGETTAAQAARKRVSRTSRVFPLRARSDAVVVGSLGQQNVPPLSKGSARAFQAGLILSIYWLQNRSIADPG